jgi:hypothetical protein
MLVTSQLKEVFDFCQNYLCDFHLRPLIGREIFNCLYPEEKSLLFV